MITKLGSDFSKQAGWLSAARAGIGLFKDNIIPALSTVGKNILPAAKTVMNNVRPAASVIGNTFSHSQGPILNRFTNTFRAGKNILGSGASLGLTQNQSTALNYGLKGAGILGTIGVASRMGNKNYNQTMSDLDRMKQYQNNININTNQPKPDIVGNS